MLSFPATCLALVISLTAGAQQKKDIIFKGKADPKYNGEKMQLYNNKTGETDSAVIVNGGFELRAAYSEPTRYMFASNYEARTQGGYAPFGIVVEGPGTVNIDADIASFNKSKVSNAPAHEAVQWYNEHADALDRKCEQVLIKKYGKSDLLTNRNYEKEEWFKSVLHDADSASDAHNNQVIEAMVRKFPNSIGAAYIMAVYSSSLPLKLQEELYGLFKDRVKQTSYGKSTLELIEARKYSAIGQTAYGFTMNNELGKAVELASFRGKYVLIDFWASWCGPCIASFPKLKEVYEQYKNKGFEIVGISTDKSESAWHTAVKKYLNPWPQLRDTQNIANKYFAVKVLPTTYLIDPDGKIIARDVHAEELGAKLGGLLK